MFPLKTVFVVILLTTLLAKDVISFVAESFEEPVDVDMKTNTLNLKEGRRQSVSCTVNRPRCFFISSPVEFLFGRYSCPDCPWTTLTQNDQVVVEDGEDHYEIDVTSPRVNVTSFNLVFKSPRQDFDHGHLRCRLTLDPRLGLRMMSSSVDRFVIVF